MVIAKYPYHLIMKLVNSSYDLTTISPQDDKSRETTSFINIFTINTLLFSQYITD